MVAFLILHNSYSVIHDIFRISRNDEKVNTSQLKGQALMKPSQARVKILRHILVAFCSWIQIVWSWSPLNTGASFGNIFLPYILFYYKVLNILNSSRVSKYKLFFSSEDPYISTVHFTQYVHFLEHIQYFPVLLMYPKHNCSYSILCAD